MGRQAVSIHLCAVPILYLQQILHKTFKYIIEDTEKVINANFYPLWLKQLSFRINGHREFDFQCDDITPTYYLNDLAVALVLKFGKVF